MRLKRLLFFLLFLTLTFSFGQTAANKKSIGDTLTIDRNSAIEKRSYTEDFKDNYTAEKYQYEVDAAPNGWFSRLKQWFKDLFIKLFQLNSDVEANKLIDIISRIVYLLIIIVVIYIIVKAILNNSASLKLDETLNNNINTGSINKVNLINKVKKITSIIKDIKKI